MRHGLFHRRARESLLAGGQEVADGLLRLARLGAMVRQLFGLARGDFGKLSFQRGGDAAVN
ncbi:MAG TPA: hypothetical protein VMI72_14500 [Roseiarcus sp.]|nr:hypothetical protein [Roseiarcus sp.]